jgi:hypothetical protein
MLNLAFVPMSLLLAAAIAFQQPMKVSQPAEPDRAGWKSLFNGKSLEGWKPAGFSGAGQASIKDGMVILGKGNSMTGITYTRGDFPTMDYEVSLEGKKLEGDDFFCTTTFPAGRSFCSFVVGGWSGTTVGLSSIDSMDASMNETSTSREFDHGRWYRVRIRVTKDRIQAWIDDERLVNLVTAGRKIGIRLECGPCKPFGIATWETSGAVRNIRVRALTDGEKKPAVEKSANETRAGPAPMKAAKTRLNRFI